jgi:hypothetical protein
MGRFGSKETSLRATGSRECAPDDKLREAIQKAHQELDCFVAARNDEALPNCI